MQVSLCVSLCEYVEVYDGHKVIFCIDVYVEVSLYVEKYEYVEVYYRNMVGSCVDMDAYV